MKTVMRRRVGDDLGNVRGYLEKKYIDFKRIPSAYLEHEILLESPNKYHDSIDKRTFISLCILHMRHEKLMSKRMYAKRPKLHVEGKRMRLKDFAASIGMKVPTLLRRYQRGHRIFGGKEIEWK